MNDALVIIMYKEKGIYNVVIMYNLPHVDVTYKIHA
jgi:hypothetical protein